MFYSRWYGDYQRSTMPSPTKVFWLISLIKYYHTLHYNRDFPNGNKLSLTSRRHHSCTSSHWPTLSKGQYWFMLILAHLLGMYWNVVSHILSTCIFSGIYLPLLWCAQDGRYPSEAHPELKNPLALAYNGKYIVTA